MISAFPAPTKLAKYDLLEEIGHGGMATVYRARDTLLDRDVALKLLHRHLRESEEVKRRFVSEARAVAKLRHPNIVEVFDVSDPDEPERYLVVELISGPTLRQLIQEQGPLPPELAAAIVLELAAALEHAHARGVIHRDIKPENVLIELPSRGIHQSQDDLERARIKLADFGIAKLLDAQGVTSTGQVLGSPAHMAPEQIEGKNVDARADVFSLGVLFYECLTGCLPFAGKNPAQVLRNVLEGNFARPEILEPQVGSTWSGIVVRALAREPSERFDDIAGFAEAVRGELTALGFGEVRRDILDYLREPQSYVQRHPERIVAALARDGQRARAQRQFALARARFSRALAYRPGDRDLLRWASALKRSSLLRRVGWYLGAVMLLGAAVVSSSRFWPDQRRPSEPNTKQPSSLPATTLPSTSSAAPQVPRLARPMAPVPAQAPAETTVKPPRQRVKPVVTRRVTKRVEEADETIAETRQVSVRLTGAVGGTVRIDGEEKAWFGVNHTLTVGTHVFDFIPPNDVCCVATRKQVEVQPGEGVEVVVGHIPFKDAALVVESEVAEGWVLSCPTLFSGQLSLPGRRSVPMNQVEATGTCTLSSASEAAVTRSKAVTLRAGQTTVLAWP